MEIIVKLIGWTKRREFKGNFMDIYFCPHLITIIQYLTLFYDYDCLFKKKSCRIFIPFVIEKYPLIYSRLFSAMLKMEVMFNGTNTKH